MQGICDDQEAGDPDQEAGAAPSADADAQYDTPASLVTMEALDIAKLEQGVYEGLVQVRANGMVDGQPTHLVHAKPSDAGSATWTHNLEWTTGTLTGWVELTLNSQRAVATAEHCVPLQCVQDISTGRLGRLPTSSLNVPVFNAPPAAVQTLKGYQGGEFDPEKRGAAYFVVKKRGVEGVIQTHNKRDAKWTLNPVKP